MPAIDIDREAAHDAAQRELAKPIYPSESLTDRFSDWLDEILYRIMRSGSAFPGGWLTITVLAILLMVAIIVAVRIARRTMRTRRDPDSGIFGTNILSAAEHRSIAESAAAQGNWSAAIRHRLRAVARHLEETNIVGPVPGRTANELARDAGSSLPGLATDFSSAATIFNDVTYGEQPGTGAGYRLIVTLDDDLQHAAPQSRRATSPNATDTWATVR